MNKPCRNKEKVILENCSSYSQPIVDRAVRSCLEKLNFRFKKNSRVLIKPNLLSSFRPERAITTHPSVVEAVCKVLKKAGCRITIAESSGFFTQEKHLLFSKTGIEKVAKKYGAEILLLEKLSSREYKGIYQGSKIQLPELKKFDLIINMPKLKTHSLTKYTGAVKNLYGFVPGGLKQRYHVEGRFAARFSRILLDIYALIKPELNIMDGVVGLEGEGPGSAGVPRKTGYIIASRNAAALDFVASGIIGYNPMEILVLRFAKNHFLLPEAEVIGKKKIVNYKKPKIQKGRFVSFLFRLIFMRDIADPYLIKEKCTKCGTCARVCPVKCIKMEPYPVWDYKECIHCYCCHENCPYNAIELRRSWLERVGQRLANIYYELNKKGVKNKRDGKGSSSITQLLSRLKPSCLL